MFCFDCLWGWPLLLALRVLVAVVLIVCDCFGWLISYSGYLITFVGCLCLLDCLKLLFLGYFVGMFD